MMPPSDRTNQSCRPACSARLRDARFRGTGSIPVGAHVAQRLGQHQGHHRLGEHARCGYGAHVGAWLIATAASPVATSTVDSTTSATIASDAASSNARTGLASTRSRSPGPGRTPSGASTGPRETTCPNCATSPSEPSNCSDAATLPKLPAGQTRAMDRPFKILNLISRSWNARGRRIRPGCD